MTSVTNEDIQEIRCPVCKSPVELKPDKCGFRCLSCRRVYPIRDGIHAFIVDQATIEDDEPVAHV